MSVHDAGPYFCFSCGAKGHAYDFLTTTAGLSKSEAIAELSGFGLQTKPPPVNLPSRGQKHSYRSKDGSEVGRVYVRLSENGKKVSQWSAAASSYTGWIGEKMNAPIWYRLPEIEEHDNVLIVEGEKCADAVASLNMQGAVTTWPGGASAKLDALDLGPLRGRDVILWPDNDAPGLKVMNRLAAMLNGVAKNIDILVLPPEIEPKWDVADFIKAGAVAKDVISFISLNRTEWVPPPPSEKEIEPKGLSAEFSSDFIDDNPHFRILGNKGAATIVCQRKRSGEIIDISNSSLARPGTYSLLAPKRWWETQINSPRISSLWREELTCHITQKAVSKGMFDFGRVVERGVFLSGKEKTVVINLGNRLHIPETGKDVDLGAISDPIFKQSPPLKMPQRAAEGRERLAELGKALYDYRFETNCDRMIFYGWMISALIGGAIKWRPHAWLIGGSNSGKSWLLREVLHRFCGDWSENIGKTTVAGLVRSIGSSGLPQILDEAEHTGSGQQGFWEQLALIMRISSDGVSAMIKADVGSADRVVKSIPRCCFLLSSISIPRRQRADESRCSTIKLSALPLPSDKWHLLEENLLSIMEHSESMRAEVLFSVPEILQSIDESRKYLMKNGVGTREADQLSAIAGAASWGSGLPINYIVKILQQGVRAASDAEHISLLSEIVAAEVLVDRGIRMTVGEILGSPQCAGERDSAIARHGLRWDVGGRSNLLIAPSASGLKRLLSGSRFANADLSILLKRIPGVIELEGRKSIGSQRYRSVLSIPVEQIPIEKEVDHELEYAGLA